MHTLTESELPVIDGYFTLHGQEHGSIFYTKNGHMTGTLASSKYQSFAKTTGTGADSYTNVGFSFGSGSSHNNLPPYRAVNIWKRTE